MVGSELVDLAETVGTGRKPTKAIEFSPQVTQFFNIAGFLEIFRSFYGTFRGKIGDFWNIFGEILERFFRLFWGIFVARPITNTNCSFSAGSRAKSETRELRAKNATYAYPFPK